MILMLTNHSLPIRVVALKWFGHPWDTPVDVRARPVIIRWPEKSDIKELRRAGAIVQGKVVHRWEYVCRGQCELQDMSEDVEDPEDAMCVGDGVHEETTVNAHRWSPAQEGLDSL
jgi:hypothetical protein